MATKVRIALDNGELRTAKVRKDADATLAALVAKFKAHKGTIRTLKEIDGVWVEVTA